MILKLYKALLINVGLWPRRLCKCGMQDQQHWYTKGIMKERIAIKEIFNVSKAALMRHAAKEDIADHVADAVAK